MKFSEALTAVIDQQYAGSRGYFHPPTRDEIAAGDKNVRIAYEVFGEPGLLNEFWEQRDMFDFGTFENCREYGVTVTVAGWTFAAYEHRNSDNICVEGCPTGEVKEYGPYGGEDKYDVLSYANWKQYHHAVEDLVRAVRHVLEHEGATRADVKAAINKGKRRKAS